MNYDELVSASKAYADRSDIEVDSNIDIFIIMTEARINRILKTREQSMRTFTLLIPDTEFYSLPLDYAGMRDIQLNSSVPGKPHTVTGIEQLSPDQFNDQRSKVYSGKPYYTIAANQLQIYPMSLTGTLELLYYQKVPGLTPTAGDNWLSTNHPDIYLSGMISEIESFVKNYEVAKAWDDKLSRALGELETSDVTERWAGTPMTMRIG